MKEHSRPYDAKTLKAMRARAEEAEAIVRAIQFGHVDAIVRSGPQGPQVFSLEGAEHIYRVMVEAMGEGALTLNREGTILYSNRRFAEMAEIELDNLIGSQIQHLLPPEGRSDFERLMRDCSDATADATMELVHPDGSRLPVRMTLRAVASEKNQTIVAVATDLSDVFRAAAARDQLARIVECAMDAIIGIDLDNKIISWNKGAEILYGYAEHEIIGQDISILAPDDNKDEAAELIANVVKGGTVERYETVRVDQDGNQIDVMVTLSPIVDALGKIAGVSGIYHDITERKRLERLQDNFVSTVSHELRTPLTSISASLALLAKGAIGKLNDRAESFVDIAYRNSDRLVRLVNDILDVEKLQSGKMQFHFEALELEPIVRNTVAAIRPMARKSGVILEVESATHSRPISTDPDRLSQAFANLLSNAIKFSSKGQKIRVRMRDIDGKFRVSIIDRGPGIPESFRSHLFERFAQADMSTQKSQPGTGLGLNIARQIIERLGGAISFESTVGKGTTFHVDLPAYQSDASSQSTPTRAVS